MQKNQSRYTINKLYRDGETQKYQKGTRFENLLLVYNTICDNVGRLANEISILFKEIFHVAEQKR